MRSHDRQGAVLVAVLLILVATVLIILQSSKALRVNYEGAAAQRTLASGGALLRTGTTIAMELLIEDTQGNDNEGDHPFESWAKVDTFYSDISNDLESGEIDGTLVAEDGKLSLNALTMQGGVGEAAGAIFLRLVDKLAAAHGLDADPKRYLASLKVWLGTKPAQGDPPEDAPEGSPEGSLDPGLDGEASELQEEGQGNAQGNAQDNTSADMAWYASQDPPYKPTGGIFTTPEELQLVRWAGVEDEDRLLILHGTDEIPGLLEFITVWGTGVINMNAAPTEIVEAICPNVDLRNEFVTEIEDYRSKEEHQFNGTWYMDIATRVGLDAANFPSRAVGSISTVFRLDMTAHVGAGQLHSTAIIQRKGKRCVVLFENIH